MVSSKILCLTSGIASGDYAILPQNDMPKRETIQESETIGQRLRRAREELGLSAVQLRVKILEEYRFEVGASTILGIELDQVPNPGRKTIEFIAKGLGLDPLQVFALGLDDPPELDDSFTDSQFAQMARDYKQVRKDKKPLANDWIKTLIEKFKEWH